MAAESEGVGGTAGGSLQIFNSTIILTAGQYVSRGIYYKGSSLLVSGCDIEMNSVASTAWSLGMEEGSGTALTVINTIINLTGPTGNYGIYTLNGKIINSSITTQQTTPSPGYNHNYGVDGGNFSIYNSTINATTTTDPGTNSWGIKAQGNIQVANSSVSSSGYGINMVAPGPLSVNNSQISGTTLGINKAAGNFTIGSSQIGGGHNGVAGTDKVVNCYDGSYNPPPNL